MSNIFNNHLFTATEIAPSAISKIFQLIHLSEKLKIHLRYGRTSNGQQESVAAHCWRLALLVLLSTPYLKKPFNTEKALTMALIHDLVEIEVNDHHFLDLEDPTFSKNIHKKELEAIENIKKHLNSEIGDNIYNYWVDFEKQGSYEAKVVKALDKIEGYIQQNEAPLSTWTKEETESVFYYLDQYCDFDPFLKDMKNLIIEEAKEKLRKNNKNLLEILLKKYTFE